MNTKRQFILIAIMVALCAPAIAADIQITWDAVGGADGYNVFCAPVADTPIAVPVAATTYTLTNPPTGVTQECYVRATGTDPLGSPIESADSNHIQFTPPAVAQTIVVPGQPSNVTIQWQ